MTWLVWVGVALLGGVGAVSRFHLDLAVQLRARSEFPSGTFVVNVLGCLCLGLLTGSGVTGNALLLVGTGGLGSFTTFSTWVLETQRLGEDGENRVAVWNLGISVGAGLVFASIGWAIGAAL